MNVDALQSISLNELSHLRLRASDSIGTSVAAACLLEASAVKAGNVHPSASFHDMNYDHFRQSAFAVGNSVDSYLAEISPLRVGGCIYRMTIATKQNVGVNTNLGTLLLLGPLVIARHRLNSLSPSLDQLHGSLSAVLADLDFEDCQAIYQSIAIINPGGLGKSDRMDANGLPPQSILEAMEYSRDKDDVAKQWVTGFTDVFCIASKLLHRMKDSQSSVTSSWLAAISNEQIGYLAESLDSLIVRKTGSAIAEKVRLQARELLHSYNRDSERYEEKWNEFDRYLRADQNRRNPGTTADLLAASTFVALVCF